MLLIKKPDLADKYAYSLNGCGCDIYTPSGDCKYVDDGGCGCDD